MLWVFIASVNVVIAHSGTWKNDPHTAHHKYLNCNYGAGPLLMDKIFIPKLFGGGLLMVQNQVLSQLGILIMNQPHLTVLWMT